MYSSNNDFISGLIKAALATNFLAETKKIDTPRKYLECHPSIQTVVTDEDMLLLRIDHALSCGDEKRFIQLTDELKGMGVLV